MARTAFIFEAGLVAVALLLGWFLGAPPFAGVRFDWADAALGMLATVPMLAGMLLVARVDWEPFKRIVQRIDKVLVPIFRDCSLGTLAAIALAAGVGEEALFRGVLQAKISTWTSPTIGLVAASLLFGAAHFVTPAYAVLATVVGGYLGWLHLATGNLVVPVVAHGLYDLVALLWLIRGSAVRGQGSEIRGPEPDE